MVMETICQKICSGGSERHNLCGVVVTALKALGQILSL